MNNKYIDNKDILNLNNINDLNVYELRHCVSYYHYKDILDRENIHHLYEANDLDEITDKIIKMHPDQMRDYLMQIRKSNKYILDLNNINHLDVSELHKCMSYYYNQVSLGEEYLNYLYPGNDAND
jgi:hypothetical protein